MKIEKWMIKEDFHPKFNVLYFGDEFDFRLIPKNCSTTAKVVWSQIQGLKCNDRRLEGNPHGIIPNDAATLGNRIKMVKTLGNNTTFRPHTKNIAVKRDPIERWVSAINFCILMKQHKSDGKQYLQYNDANWIDWDINMIVAYQLGHGFMVSELLPQSYCGGNVANYHYVFTKDTMEDFYTLIENHFGVKLERVVTTRTDNVGKWKVKDLNKHSIEILKHIYANDYKLGWHL